MNTELNKTRKSYSDVDRRKAVVLFMTLGNMQKVSEATGISDRTLAHWKLHSDWWNEIVGEVRDQITDEIRARTDNVVKAAFDQLDDRLEHGDYKTVDKKLQRVPMSGRDVAWCAAVFIDKRQILSHQPTSITGNVDGRLNEFMAKFEQLGRAMSARTIEGKTVDSVTVSATNTGSDS